MKRLWEVFREDYGIYHAPPEKRGLAVFLACVSFSLIAAAFTASLFDLQLTGDAETGMWASLVCALAALPFAFALDRFRTKPFGVSRTHSVWFLVLVALIVSVYLLEVPVIVVAIAICVHTVLSGAAVVAGLLHSPTSSPAPPVMS